MHTKDCTALYYFNRKQVVNSMTYMPVIIDELYYEVTAKRPWLPFQLMKLPSEPLERVIIAGQLSQTELYYQIAMECYAASVNWQNGIASFPQYTDGEFNNYLYKLLFGKTFDIDRYKSLHSEVFQYLDNESILYTEQQYNVTLRELIAYISENGDRASFIAPGTYRFDIAGTVGGMIGNLIAAGEDYDFGGFKILEINSIG